MKKYAKLFATALMGSALIGCSATPEVNDNYQYSEPKTDAAASTTQGAADQGAQSGATDLDAGKKAMTPEQMKAMLSGKVIYFEYDRSDIRTEYYDIIKMNAEYLNQNPQAKLTIAGHCDERGSREYNLALGERRALSVKNAIMAEGISSDRVNVISFGEDMPVDEGHSEASWSKNRRAEFNY